MDKLSENRTRIRSIDLLRGLVMIIMALDHTRDFTHIDGMSGNPLDFATTTPLLFMTRWITHFCAPVFVFLAGTSAYLMGLRKTKAELSRFLITRGIWLVFVEVVIINLVFSFDIHYGFIGLQTIWSIGISMIILGLAIRLPFAALLTLGLVIVFGHNLLDLYEKGHTGPFPVWYSFLHAGGFFRLWDNHYLGIMYPFLSWSGLMMTGYCFGKIMDNNDEVKRKQTLLKLGAGIVLLFIALRAINVYGDPDPWSSQKDTLFTVFSFINTHKYPPSLLYMCMTIGPAILFMAIAGNKQNRLTRIISVYGRVPFFYYVLHFFLIHLVSAALFLSRGHSIAEGFHNTGGGPNFIIQGEGYGLRVVYLVWIGVVVALYPLCKWYDNYKTNHKEKWWLSYL